MKENRLENFAGRGAGLSGPALFPAYLYSGGHSYAAKGDPARRLFYADLDPVIGSEQGGTRPILILQNDVGNYFSPTVVAAAITSRRDKTHLPTHVLLEDVPGLAPTSLLLLEQIRTVDRRRLRGYIGQISKKKMKEIDTALAISVGLRSLA